MNWISPTGRSPCAAIPTHSPLINSSESGVSTTRSGPNRCCSPTVARKTPPLTPTSSPSTTTLASSCMTRASARLTASTNVASGISASQLLALAGIASRELGVEMVEHRLRGPRRGRQIALDSLLDALLALGGKLLFLRLAPCLPGHEIRAQARDRLLLPAGLDLLRRAVTRGVIGGRVVAEPVGHGLDQARPQAGAGIGDRLRGSGVHCDDVVAVHLLARKARGDGLLGQRLGRGLQLERHRDGPLIVVGDKHHGQLVHAGEVHRLPDVALGGRAVAEQADRNPRLLSELERIGDAGSVRRLRSHRNAKRKVVDRAGGMVAALVAAPKK